MSGKCLWCYVLRHVASFVAGFALLVVMLTLGACATLSGGCHYHGGKLHCEADIPLPEINGM